MQTTFHFLNYKRLRLARKRIRQKAKADSLEGSCQYLEWVEAVNVLMIVRVRGAEQVGLIASLDV